MNWGLLLPEMLLAGLAFAVLAGDLVLPARRQHLLGYGGAAGVLGIGIVAAFLWGRDATLFNGLFLVDEYAIFFKVLFLGVGCFILLGSVEFVKKHLSHPGEYYGLVLFSVLAMMLMAAAGELITAYLSLELLSFSLYILVAYARRELRSTEAGTKYLLLGAFSSALLLYGLSLIYGLAGVTTFQGLAAWLQGRELSPALGLGMVLVISGLGFKMAVVPFHMWAPDVYEGAPLPVTAFLSVAAKGAGLALFLRLLAVAFSPLQGEWTALLAALAVATMFVGNLVAIPQRNIKRLLAYSSIGQAGYLLVGLAALSPQAANGLLFHLAGYTVSNLAAFMAVIAFFHHTGKEDISAFAGLADRSPFLAFTLSIAFLSLAGLPIFAGFTTKFYLFTAAAQGGLLWLVGIAVLNSLISFYYYLLVLKQMYIQPAEDPSPLPLSPLWRGMLAVLVAGVLFIGVYPHPLLQAISASTRFLF